MKKEYWIALAVAAGWYFFRRQTTKYGTILGSEQSQILAEQDAAFSGSSAFETAPFHGFFG